MSEAKFTKGEWNSQFGDMVFASNGVNNEQVAIVCNENNGDKHLIAAAPEMYADIENDIKELSHELNNKNLTPHARAHLTNKLNVKTKLLAKARGEK